MQRRVQMARFSSDWFGVVWFGLVRHTQTTPEHCCKGTYTDFLGYFGIFWDFFGFLGFFGFFGGFFGI